ncbi:isoprenyl transferase [Tepidibacillus fermentans]|uniref:Isoprenyl transferase n=1 Tax=Tepidibacillus fermentans TaxID=1281767 RepID=A0A4R3KIH2_9BACI|nr:isoprenyl transferase [Tepidibacillus fermentans]TCS82974.1 undecaprenyl diphosphate synthase [Tepidibacillus fermentans]
MFKGLFQNTKNNSTKIVNIEDLNPFNIPKHVAIIMDGNGRWAKGKGLPRIAGHRAGMEAIKRVAKAANKVGVEIVTLFAFSTENWKRPENEVNFLMGLPQEFLLKEIDELNEQNVQVKIMGFDENLPEHTIKAVREAERRTEKNTGLILNFALNYGSRHEIVHATKSIVHDVLEGKITEQQIDERLLGQYLLTKNYPDPDLLIRTSGELRLSNFLLWQMAYTELYFTSAFWPEFNEQHFIEAIYDYQQRGRRFGAI